jgi:hypothetical protein
VNYIIMIVIYPLESIALRFLTKRMRIKSISTMCFGLISIRKKVFFSLKYRITEVTMKMKVTIQFMENRMTNPIIFPK